MAKSVGSYQSVDGRDSHDDVRSYAESLEQQEERDTYSSTTPTSPTTTFRRQKLNRASENDLSQHAPTERTSLLGNTQGSRSYMSLPATTPGTPRPQLHGPRRSSQNPTRNERLRHSRAGSISRTFSQRLVNALGSAERRAALGMI
jgi:chloride channel 3/4/5